MFVIQADACTQRQGSRMGKEQGEGECVAEETRPRGRSKRASVKIYR
jgi:hypothetical protein